VASARVSEASRPSSRPRRQARQGDQEIGKLLACGCDAEDVQAVADLQLLQLAE